MAGIVCMPVFTYVYAPVHVFILIQTLHDSATKLQLVVQHYNSITQQLTDTTRLLFHNKLELTEEVRFTYYTQYSSQCHHDAADITWTG